MTPFPEPAVQLEVHTLLTATAHYAVDPHGAAPARDPDLDLAPRCFAGSGSAN
ncbi:hypothetical protein RKD27_000235 [Streptomyces sp. SAI-126]|uniref:hypothetical protein n=1 Tax=Streptomyces sp. SAI-126 TaxID=3377732 RepID=UPI003C7A65EA